VVEAEVELVDGELLLGIKGRLARRVRVGLRVVELQAGELLPAREGPWRGVARDIERKNRRGVGGEDELGG